MTTYNLNITNISLNSSIDNIEGLNDEFNDLQNKPYNVKNEDGYTDKKNDIDEGYSFADLNRLVCYV